MNEEVLPSLILNNLVFDEIKFKRLGFKNDNELKVKIESTVSVLEDESYRVVLTAKGKKEKEYYFIISLVGLFSWDRPVELPEETLIDITGQNTAAILMPYLRSEISLLTAQPGVESALLPPINVAELLKREED